MYFMGNKHTWEQKGQYLQTEEGGVVLDIQDLSHSRRSDREPRKLQHRRAQSLSGVRGILPSSSASEASPLSSSVGTFCDPNARNTASQWSSN